MTLEEKVIADMKDAMRAKDKDTLRGIRAIKAAIMLAKTDGSGEAMTPEKEIKLVQKMVKQRKESLGIYLEQGREDLAEVEKQEIETISRYLPKQLGADELKAIIEKIIADTGASGMKDMGKVMGIASGKLAGSADGKAISTVVKSLLA